MSGGGGLMWPVTDLDTALYTATALFWVCSFAVLALRWQSRTMQDLARYGGRAAAAVAAPAPSAGGALRWVKGTALGTTRVSRRTSFVIFYAVGLAAVAGRCAGLPRGHSRAPLLCFGLHCLWRLVETLCVFHYRPKSEDSVSLFAALSGSVFYVFAAVSCDAAAATGAGGDAARPRAEQLRLAAGMNIFALAYIVVQLAQSSAHRTLATLRRPPTAAAPAAPPSRAAAGHSLDDDDGEDDDDDAQYRRAMQTLEGAWAAARQCAGDDAAAAAVPRPAVLAEPRLLSYRFPYRRSRLFACVLEPHYTAEIALYALNAAATAAAAPADAAALRWACAGGVLAFTALNLALTAAEHRDFWRRANGARRAALQLLRDNAEDGPRRRECTFVLREETLPSWNLLYGVW